MITRLVSFALIPLLIGTWFLIGSVESRAATGDDTEQYRHLVTTAQKIEADMLALCQTKSVGVPLVYQMFRLYR